MRILKPLLLILAVMLLASCASRKQFVYLNDMTPGESYPINTAQGTVVHENDRLDIKVSCKNLELAVPFNTQTGAYQVSADGSVRTAGVDLAEQGYRVDADGCIVFPILGKIEVAGKSIKEVSELIETMIKDGDYISDPEVTIEFLNFKYTVNTFMTCVEVLCSIPGPGRSHGGGNVNLLEYSYLENPTGRGAWGGYSP